MCTRLHSNGSTSRTSQSLFDYVLQKRQELNQQHSRQPVQLPLNDDNAEHHIAATGSASSAAAWSDDDDDDEKLCMDRPDTMNNHRSHLKRSMSRRGAIGFACAFTQTCIETTNYFYDNPSDDSFVPPLQRPPERTGSSAKKRCRIGRAESSGSHHPLEDQFAAVAISEYASNQDLDDEDAAEDMERSVRRKMHMEEEFGSSHHTHLSNFDDAGAATAGGGVFIDTAGHFSIGNLMQRQQSLWSMDSNMQHSGSNDSTMTMDDL
jgi:hypothetical protein